MKREVERQTFDMPSGEMNFFIIVASCHPVTMSYALKVAKNKGYGGDTEQADKIKH